MNQFDIAKTQAMLAFFWSGMFAFVLVVLIIHPPTLDEFVKGIILTMLGYLGALVQQHSSYFFARQRPETPTPGETTVKTTPATTTVTTAAAPTTTTATVTTKETPDAAKDKP
jgi:hypothetical protein